MASTTYQVSNNGDVIYIDVVFKHLSGDAAATGVAVVFSVDSGLSIANFTPSYGTYSSGISTWNIGSLAKGTSATGTLKIQVSNIALAYALAEQGNKLGFKVTAVGSADSDSEASNNTMVWYLLRGECLPSQSSSYYQPNTGTLSPPNMCLVDDELSGVTGNVTNNDKISCSGCATTRLEVVADSESNVTINGFDTVNGNYSVTLIDGTQAWSFQYTGYCEGCADGNNYGPFDPATVSGPALFQCLTVYNCIAASPSTTPTPSVTPTTSVTPTVTPTISVSPTVTPSVTPTTSVTPSITPTTSVTPTVTPTVTVTPSPSPV